MSDPFIGQIQPVGFNFPPRSWAFCDGQLLSVSQNTALFSLLGTAYGGDGRNTFGLPDLRGRVMIHPGTGPGLSTKRQGERGGLETVTLTVQQIPSHNHPVGDIMASSVTGNAAAPSSRKNVLSASSAGNIYGNTAPDVALNAGGTAGVNGGGQGHENRSPYLAVYICIALFGIFPSRN